MVGQTAQVSREVTEEDDRKEVYADCEIYLPKKRSKKKMAPSPDRALSEASFKPPTDQAPAATDLQQPNLLAAVRMYQEREHQFQEEIERL